MTFGVMLPHFGPNVTAGRLLGAGELVEQLGYDAVWVRDHLLWRPHAHEARESITFLEPLITLATLGARTQRLLLGTSVLIPIRAPLKAAQELAALSFLSGGRVVAGLGAGHEPAELRMGGVDPSRRRQAVTETIDILRRAWTEDHVVHQGEIYTVDDATLEPKPVVPIPILFGGPSRIAVQIAAERCDGWIAGTLPWLTLDDRLAHLAALEAASGRRLLRISVPRIRIGPDREKVRTAVNVAGLVEDGQHHWIRPPSGDWTGFEDVEGAVMAGDPADIVAGVLEFWRRGFDHFVFDIRSQFATFEATLGLISEQVVPVLRSAMAATPSDDHAKLTAP
jgi:alkanesulfonate monooxygenase SsuD/methylene tetrahydromethanopterin reductase-like flavin-dependent oxidoreductase (luciferase family)